ncbi:hypothetical protein V1514DRAFT_305390 [Lipomyces japonicus]|uniref:uncharacterized protein n=1 Tax=Lipomyces japonicus TaxID=56871 RepID=UPI0034CE402A
MARSGRKYSRLPRNPPSGQSSLPRQSTSSSLSSSLSLADISSPISSSTAARDSVSSPGGVSLSTMPKSPPPSFRSTASYMPIQPDDPLARSFDVPGEEEEDDDDHVQRESDDYFFRRSGSNSDVVSSTENNGAEGTRLLPTTDQTAAHESYPAQDPALNSSSSASSSANHAAPSNSNDGVFANITAKPEANEKPAEENPPSYEEAAADATPPYWETTIIAPGMGSDEVFIDGLPVGNFFNFVWNMLISMSFQFVGFLLTYLLHTTHAAKNGSRAGLGITLIQYGFYLRSAPDDVADPGGEDSASAAAKAAVDPNSYDVQSASAYNSTTSDTALYGGSMDSSEWFSYFLMLAGWFLLIKSLANFFRVRKMEQVILRAPDSASAQITETAV